MNELLEYLKGHLAHAEKYGDSAFVAGYVLGLRHAIELTEMLKQRALEVEK